MVINAFQAALLGLFACLASMPGLGGTSIGNYTLGRPARRRPCGRHHPGRHHRRHPRRHGHPGGLHRPSSPLAAPSRPTSARPATSASRSPSSPSRPRGSTPAARRPRPSRPRSAPRAAPWAPSCSTAPRRSTWPGRPWAGSGSRRGDTHKLYLVDMVLPWISPHHLLLPAHVPARLLWRRRGEQPAGEPAHGRHPHEDPVRRGARSSPASVSPSCSSRSSPRPPTSCRSSSASRSPRSWACNLIAASAIACFFALINYEITTLRLKVERVGAAGALSASTIDDEDEEDI